MTWTLAHVNSGTMSPRKKKKFWESLPLEELLDVRMCDLKLSISGTPLERRIEQVREEVWARDLMIKPYFWLSDDWFTPDGYTGMAIPFYLAHPRLTRLERSQIGEVEGGTKKACLQFLRHEIGHIVDHSFMLHRRKRWQQLFGLSSHKYPRFYRPNPYSRRHVQHLEYWYAQSHPDEDFAETFAVWLTPRSQWKKAYRGWPALRKLEYVDQLMSELAGKKPLVYTRAYVDSLPRLKKTLRQHYRRKKNAYAGEYPNLYDRDLMRLFSNSPRHRNREAASSFIRRMRPEVMRLVSRWTGEYRYQLEHVLKDITGRCRDLKLHVRGSESNTKIDFAILLTKHTMDSLYRNRRWVEM